MKFKCLLLICCFLAFSPSVCEAQLYTGMSGLIKNPSADMNETGEAVIAAYFLNRHFTPGSEGDLIGFVSKGKKYDTFGFSIALTPFSWMEIGYTMTLQKTIAEGHTKPRFNQKDRFISVKFLPLKEGKYWPAIAIGSNDFIGSALRRSRLFLQLLYRGFQAFHPEGSGHRRQSRLQICAGEVREKMAGGDRRGDMVP